MFQPLRLRSVHADASTLAGKWLWSSDDQKLWQLSVSALGEKRSSDTYCWVVLDAEGRSLVWVFPDELCRWLGLQQLMVLNPSLAMRAAAIAIAQHEAAELIGADASISVTIDSADKADQRHEAMSVVISQKSHQVGTSTSPTLNLRMSHHLLMQHMAKERLIPQSGSEIADHPCSAFVDATAIAIVGSLMLHADDIARFEPGCLILLAGSYVQQGILQIQVGQTTFSLMEDNNTSEWTVLEINVNESNQELWAETHQPENQEAKGAHMNLNDIRLNITVQLAQVRINVGDLTRLQTGAVISLQMPANPMVDLVCNDKTIAQGELVDLDGTLAVAITRAHALL